MHKPVQLPGLQSIGPTRGLRFHSASDTTRRSVVCFVVESSLLSITASLRAENEQLSYFACLVEIIENGSIFNTLRSSSYLSYRPFTSFGPLKFSLSRKKMMKARRMKGLQRGVLALIASIDFCGLQGYVLNVVN